MPIGMPQVVRPRETQQARRAVGTVPSRQGRPFQSTLFRSKAQQPSMLSSGAFQNAQAQSASTYVDSYANSYGGSQDAGRTVFEKDGAWYEAFDGSRLARSDFGLTAQDFMPAFPSVESIQEALQPGMGHGSITMLSLVVDPDGSPGAREALERAPIIGHEIIPGFFPY